VQLLLVAVLMLMLLPLLPLLLLCCQLLPVHQPHQLQ
jgi:hypothetical protein